MTPTTCFRWADARDIDALLVLVQAAYRDEKGNGWTTEAHLLGGQRTDRADLEEIIGGAAEGILLCEVGGDIIGSCHMKRLEDGCGYLGMFSVRPDRQGAGIGRALMAEAERISASDWSAREVRLLVLQQRPELVAWYERLGYQPTGRAEPFPHRDERFGRPKVDDLLFVELAKPLGSR